MEVSRRDIFRKGDKFGVMVESSNAETALSETEKRTKIAFLNSQANNPIQNPQKAYEIQASIAGFEEDTVRQLLDTSDYGNAELMSEAERDIEALLDGEKIAPNQNANTAYKQRLVDYLKDNMENMEYEQFVLISEYILSLEDVINRNMVAQANATLFKQKMAQLSNPSPELTPSGAKPMELGKEDINNNGEMPIE